MTIEIRETTGTCRWCGCTWQEPCDSGCGWANRAQTLCTACVTVDRQMRTARGRAKIVAAWNVAEEQKHHDQDDLDLLARGREVGVRPAEAGVKAALQALLRGQAPDQPDNALQRVGGGDRP